MAPTESLQNRHVPLLHFIIALLLVKSKPSSLSGPDFRRQLVSHIEEGSRSNHSTEAGVHIDTAAFWRNKSTGLEEENAALEAKVSRLQARVSELEKREDLRKRKSAEVEDSARSQRLKRRRDREPAGEPSGRSTKRPRTKVSAVATDERDAVLQTLINDDTGSAWDELGNNILNSLRNIQGSTIARREYPLGPKDLARELSKIATGICRHVSAIDLPANLQKLTSTTLFGPNPRSEEQMARKPQAELGNNIEQRLTSIGRTFPHFLAHLHTLSQFSGSGNLCGQVVHRFIDIFRVLFQRICDLAAADAKSDQDRPKATKKQDNGQKKPHGTSSSDERPATSPIIMKLCKLVISMLFHLDPINSTNKAILEGYFYLLVTRVGEVLKDFTVGGRPFGIQEHDITSRHDPHPREGRQLKTSSAASDAEASEVQAPYLIWMLNRTQRFSSSMSPAINATTTSHDDHRQPEVTHSDGSRNAIHDDARIRLQHTLVRAVFGGQVAASFEPTLEPSHILPDDDIMTNFETETADVRDWFKNEVWRLVGWEVLRGNIAWG